MPAFPLEPGAAPLEIPVKAVVAVPLILMLNGGPPTMLREPASSVTSPALPEAKVADRIWPLSDIVVAPVVVTVTAPALPLEPDSAELEIDVAVVGVPPTMFRELACSVTSPALPEPYVDDAIVPPRDSAVAPAVVTATLPAFPPEPGKAELEIPVEAWDAPPSMSREPAVRVTLPAFPGPAVSDAMNPALVSVVAPAVVTATWPALPVEPAPAELVIVDPPSTLKEFAAMATSPAFPAPLVLDSISAPLDRVVAPVVVTVTVPALPLERWVAALPIPVKAVVATPFTLMINRGPPTTFRDPAFNVTSPALPEANVDDRISPLLDIVVAPVVVTVTWPALPLEPGLAELEICVGTVEVPPLPLMLREPALRLTLPALPAEKVEDSICAPLESVVAPAVVTVTWPALPLEPASAELEIPVRNVAAPPSMFRAPAVSVMLPAVPAPYVDDRICAPRDSVVAPDVATVTSPAFPRDPAKAALVIPVSVAGDPPSMFREPAVSVTSPAFPLPALTDETDPPLVSDVAPVVAMITLPAVALDPDTAALEIPVAAGAAPPSMLRELAMSVTSPAFPAPWALESICAPLESVTAPVVAMLTLPAVPLDPG